MIKNYIKSAIRSLRKNKGFTAINIMGLALGLATCLIIVLYVADELGYDRYNEKAGRIFRVNEDLKLGDNAVKYAVCMAPLAKTLIAEYPYVENATRIKNAGASHVKKGTLNIVENRVAFADASLFSVFTLPMINGNAASALVEPNSVVITETTAKKYFNSVNVVGKTLMFNDNTLCKVTGVIKDVPQQSHFNFDFFISMASFPDSRSTEWLRSDYNTYVLLKDKSYAKQLEASFPALLEKFSGEQMKGQLNLTIAEFEKQGSFFRLNLIPLTDIHLKSNISGELGANGTTQYVYIFLLIAVFILLIACINFMNLSTARSSNRAREVGVRKVLGSDRKHLIAQFLTESVLVTFIGTVLAFVIALFLLPLFNQLSGKVLLIDSHSLGWILPSLLIVALVVGVLSGSYPAFYLSAFQPVDVLKGKLATGFKGGRLRSLFVVFQFSISIFLIIGTLVIYNQLNYIQTKNLGYNRNQVLVIKNVFELNNQAAIFKQKVKELPGVLNATMTGFLPTSGFKSTSIYYKDATLNEKTSIFPQSWRVDEDYISTLDMKLAAGRNFSKDMPTDSAGVVINEAAAKFLGFKEPVNSIIYRSMSSQHVMTHMKPYRILGVVKDFNFNSLHENVTPVILTLDSDNGALSIRVNTNNLSLTLKQINAAWKDLNPNVQINYSFMDQDFDASYRTEQRTGQIFIIFTTLAIVIACLGLFGLAAYAAEQRTKEIGIRKVLGASVAAITRMLSLDFVKLVGISILIASPIAWYLMNLWLRDFAYRISIQWWVMVVAGCAALVIAIITVSFQAIKAAVANPVDSLKNE
ncbi:ABC transporter permease [Mucilaginibacter sp. FT3.2]|uniref:ABC transporter permease n=1 Tax=Mucilaginibacter sp. FT3.2 TaxID=2723090 RepID=UPI001613A7AD|nr:ABC transporter permease [Mucilaginibacter sp. FT3.2]MBB6234789.1 putative ABC transport system permease protein [Mucilaginibacter sp. FT3.2]